MMSLKRRFKHTKKLLDITQNSLDDSLGEIYKQDKHGLNIQIVTQLLKNEREYWKDLIVILNTEKKETKKTRKLYPYERPW